MRDQRNNYFEKFSKYQCRFRNSLSTPHCLLAMIKKLGKIFDCRRTLVAFLTYLSKAFDFLPHDTLIAKLHAY